VCVRVRALICLELILNSINLNLITFYDLFDSRQLKGDIFTIFVIALEAAEAAIGLSILSSIYRHYRENSVFRRPGAAENKAYPPKVAYFRW
jgi:NAD(P)H-quinone oxidoreductase subunit 4L